MKGSEYRVTLKDRNGRLGQRLISASSYFAARDRARTLAASQGWQVVTIHSKKEYAYRVQRGESTIDGIQSAFTRGEVVTALKNLGFEVRRVRRHYNFQFQAPSGELVSFIATSARLLEQKLPYNEILQIMSNNVRNKNLKGALRAIIKDLKEGADSRDAFMRQSKVLGKDTALMLGIATKSGNMKLIFENVARFVERQAEFKKGLMSSMILPAVTSLSLIGALGFYVLYLLPEMMKLLGPLTADTPPLTAATLAFSDFLKANLGLISFLFIAITGGLYAYLITDNGRYFFDKIVVHVPYIGRILRSTSVEMFCRVLGILYTSSGENIDAIQQAGESSRNRFLERQIKTVAIPSMLKYGTEFAKAMELTNFFPEMAVSRFRTAGETGDVKGTSMQLADYYETENTYSMKNLINVIEVSVSLIIMGSMVFLTLLSSETANIKMDGMH